jgi:hypothetical protein
VDRRAENPLGRVATRDQGGQAQISPPPSHARLGYRPMRGGTRAAVYGVFTSLWVSGILWLVLHYAFAQQSPFGPVPNPWAVPTVHVHGLLAVAGVFLLGWVAAEHISARWGRPGSRISGYVLAAAAAVLVISGYALYYTIGRLQDAAAGVHEILGSAALVPALAHWLRRGRRWRLLA